MITVNGQVYDGVMIKPDMEDLLTHYGVKGMKWKNRKKKSGFKDTLHKILNYNSAYDSEGNPVKKTQNKKQASRKAKGYDSEGNPVYTYTNDIFKKKKK